MTDLMDAALLAIDAALNVPAVTALAPVWSNVPEGQELPYIEIGAIDADEWSESKDGAGELISVEVVYHYRGKDRRKLHAMMHAGREVLEDADLQAPGALLDDLAWRASATDREEDGTTWHGIQRFELVAQSED